MIKTQVTRHLLVILMTSVAKLGSMTFLGRLVLEWLDATDRIAEW
jgi:hypothetical protein